MLNTGALLNSQASKGINRGHQIKWIGCAGMGPNTADLLH